MWTLKNLLAYMNTEEKKTRVLNEFLRNMIVDDIDVEFDIKLKRILGDDSLNIEQKESLIRMLVCDMQIKRNIKMDLYKNYCLRGVKR